MTRFLVPTARLYAADGCHTSALVFHFGRAPRRLWFVQGRIAMAELLLYSRA